MGKVKSYSLNILNFYILQYYICFTLKKIFLNHEFKQA